MIPATPKAIKEAAAALTPKKHKNGKLNGSSLTTPSNRGFCDTPATPLTSYSPTPSVLASQFGIIQQQLQVHSNHSSVNSRYVTPSSALNAVSENGFSKKPQKPINFQCNFCTRVFTTKFSVQRHEAKLHNYVEMDHKRHYKTTYATAEDSSDAYAMDSQIEMEHSWIDGKLGSDTGSGWVQANLKLIYTERHINLYLITHVFLGVSLATQLIQFQFQFFCCFQPYQWGY